MKDAKMKQKSNRLKAISNVISIALVGLLFVLASQTSSLAVQPQVVLFFLKKEAPKRVTPAI